LCATPTSPAPIYDKLRRALKAEIDEGAWSSLYSTVSRPFPKPTTGKISGQLNASQAIFHKEAEFPGLTVTELAEFSDTIFSGPVDFSGAKIGSKLLAEVQNSGTILAGGIFKGPVVLHDAHLFDLVIQGKLDSRGITDPAASQEVTFSELDLRRAVVERTLAIENVVIQKLSAWNLTSNGLTMLKNVSITGEAELRGSRFMNLLLARLTWPAWELGSCRLRA
jgi:hypothetical protein